MRTSQIPLNISINEDLTFANFLAEGANQSVLSSLRRLQYGPGLSEQSIFLYGVAGSGVSHLLQACCLAALADGKQALYLAFSGVSEGVHTGLLEGLENFDLVCIDDVQLIAGRSASEEAFFHFYNRLRDRGGCLVMGADVSPRQLAIGLADLSSRLSASLVHMLQPLGDEQKMRLLQMRAQARGLQINDEEASYILYRSARSTGDLIEVLDRLDQAALVQQRRLTVPFIKEVMGW